MLMWTGFQDGRIDNEHDHFALHAILKNNIMLAALDCHVCNLVLVKDRSEESMTGQGSHM